MRALLCALVLVFAVMVAIFIEEKLWPEPVEGQREAAVKRSSTVYRLDNIPNIDRVIASVGKTSIDSNQNQPPVEAAILPHHTDIGSYIDQYWAEIAAQTSPEVIVIVSPAHWDQGSGIIQTTKGSWATPFGTVKTDNELIDRLQKKADVSVEPTSFENEHGISVHAPYIAHYFPNIPIVPVIAQSKAGFPKAVEFTDVIMGSEKKLLLISSIDFSHYLPAEISDRNDEETRRMIAFPDPDRIDQMGSDFLDSSFALETYLLWSSSTGCRSQERWHNHNSRLFSGIGPKDGTSYFIYTCTTRSPLRLSAVGDIMLGRGVGQALARQDQQVRTSLTRTDALLESVTASSDITFGNLESVLSDKGQPLNKAYIFEANPQHVELLKKWRISQLSVSNNHSEDYGKVAWEQSVDLLRAEGLTAIGGYSNEANIETTIAGGKKVALLAFQNLTVPFSFEKAAAAIQTAKQTHDFVVVSMHWGIEYHPNPEPSTVELAHALIDAGADIVLGHHPHVLQPVEEYNGKLIFYSLGNFVFDQVGEAQNKSMIATIDVWDDGTLTYLVTPVQIEHYFPRHEN